LNASRTSQDVCPVPDVLAYLAGRWRVGRTVRDLSSGESGRFEGAAEFGPDAGGDAGTLRHAEAGEFTWRGTTRPAHREHRYEPGTPPGTAVVRFPDGRYFHDLDLRTGRWTARHGCPPDRYRGEFTILDSESWQVVWAVTGPAKHLLLATVHQRVRPGQPGVGSPAGRPSTRRAPR
jgi:hypothetical protein